MPTVAEVLKQSGMSDEQIAAIDAKAIDALGTYAATATADRERGELAQRSAEQLFNDQINPALNAWGNKEANLTAERDYYKAQAEGAKAGGFVADVPPFVPAQSRGAGGQFVPNANVVPGSPNFQELEEKVGSALGTIADLQWQYQKLNGTVMPDSPTRLVAEAAAQRMSLTDYAAKKYDFAGRRAAIETEAKQKERDAIVKETTEARDKYWAERSGSNPNVRMAEPSRFSELSKGVKDGTRVDPLKMTREQRHAATASAIRADVAATIQ
jgi:hypothetical protein